MNILELLEKHNLNPKTSNGSQYMFNCPYHTDIKPSLSVNSELGLYCCFSCGVKGNIYTLAKELDYSMSIKDKWDILNKPRTNQSTQEDKIKLNKASIKHFFKENKNYLDLLDENNTHRVNYLITKGLDKHYNFNNSNVLNHYYVANQDIHYNNNIYLRDSLVIITDSLIQIIHKDNYKSKQFLKHSILKNSRLSYNVHEPKLYFLSEGIANYLSLQYLSDIHFNNSFSSICCFSSNNLEHFITTNKGVLDNLNKIVICIDNDDAGYRVKKIAQKIGIDSFIEFPNEKKGFDINDCFVEKLSILKNYIDKILTKCNK